MNNVKKHKFLEDDVEYDGMQSKHRVFFSVNDTELVLD